MISTEELTRRLADVHGQAQAHSNPAAHANGPGPRVVVSGNIAETCFVGAGMRKHPNLAYIPSRLSLVPPLLERTIPADAVIVHCAPPRNGMLSLGIEVNVLPAAIEGCRRRSGRIVAVVNDKMPYTFGDAQIPVDAVDYAIEVSTGDRDRGAHRRDHCRLGRGPFVPADGHRCRP